ncbi:hypothetical protein F2Q70_00012400 [Brassica cretica]|uniref:Uncharacterized protein n=1 Tax=Brassica cretica TaxID=69181 RepID=A0A8S9M4D1_BRACR|nr:hypothetical protein F2Q70_00012400 [Brassica cretica]
MRNRRNLVVIAYQALQGRNQFGKGLRIGLKSLSWELPRSMFFLRPPKLIPTILPPIL